MHESMNTVFGSTGQIPGEQTIEQRINEARESSEHLELILSGKLLTNLNKIHFGSYLSSRMKF